jgi:hypothetical protein
VTGIVGRADLLAALCLLLALLAYDEYVSYCLLNFILWLEYSILFFMFHVLY